MLPPDRMLDLTALQKFEDFVDIAGNSSKLLFLRANGDVMNIEGEVLGNGGVKVFPRGYLDSAGVYHWIDSVEIPLAAQPPKSLAVVNKRKLAVSQEGNLIAWGDDYINGDRVIPARARTGVREVGIFREWDYAVTEKGELVRWKKGAEATPKDTVKSGVAEISTSTHNGYVLSETNDVYHLNGERPKFWNEKTRGVMARGQMSAVQNMEGLWHVIKHVESGDEVETLDVVLNRKETIDAEFYLNWANRKDKWRGSYVLWIEEVGAPELNINAKKPQSTTESPRKPGVSFFGIDAE